MAKLTITSQVLAFEDDSSRSDCAINWKRSLVGLDVTNPSSDKITVEAFGIKTVFDGERVLGIDGTSVFSLALNAADSSRYRLARTSGTSPAFRTSRVVNTSGIALTLAVKANLSVTVTAQSGTPFSSVQVGDTVFVPGTATGDTAGPFNPLNVGYWNVLAASSAMLTLARPSGAIFEGVGQVVTPTANTQFQVFSAAGVQLGDVVEISGGFSIAAQKSFEVVGINPDWVEFLSTTPLASETGITPTASGISIYSSPKRFLQAEADQDCVLRLNGDTGDSNRLSPWFPGEKKLQAEYRKVGPVWKLVIVNKSPVPVNVTVISAE